MLNLIFILIGFLLGKIIFINNNLHNINKSQSFFSNQGKNLKSDNENKRFTIDIDNTKVVVPIKTDGLEKKYNNLGNTTTSSENISASIDKLKHLKS